MVNKNLFNYRNKHFIINGVVYLDHALINCMMMMMMMIIV